MLARIAGTGSYLPEAAADPAPVVGEVASDFALAASCRALRDAGSRSADVDCVVWATQAADYDAPGTACLLAAKLGRGGIPAFDVRGGTSGFLYGLAVADHFVRLGTYRAVLVAAGESVPPGLDPPPFGGDAALHAADGAGAVLLVPEAREMRGVLGAGLHTDASIWRPPSRDGAAAGAAWPARRALRREGFRRLREGVDEALESCGLSFSDVALFVSNAGSRRVADVLARRLGIPCGRLYDRLGDPFTASVAAVPMSLDDAIRTRRVGRGDIVVLVSVGCAITWAWTVLRL
ncbi:MAG TPA: 3-oxoacyl-[acyl-carrier-protein] synthase III C-terminal domain-containing protein [Candidatus Binatia bacterium]|nr:3-oxoacyl-[acyl-carrier-protein] synthase III C-terminal domain-containing protein [Candidatus Binatia bacterium]